MLSPATERVWNFLRAQPALRGFVLIGGSALAMHLQHRLSEDLDFAWPALRLPRAPLDDLLRLAAAAGFHFERNDNLDAYFDFQNAGMDLHESQQDFVVDRTVKLTFVTPDREVAAWLGHQPEAPLRVATVEEIFAMKCFVAAARSTTRDWFDLHFLMRTRGYRLRDMLAVFERAKLPLHFDTALSRLCSGVPRQGDPGLAGLVADPPTVEEMRDFFRQQRDELEVELATERFRETPPPTS